MDTLTSKIQDWLNKEKPEYTLGCFYLFSHNLDRICYKSMLRMGEQNGFEFLKKKLETALAARLSKATHEQVETLVRQAEPVAKQLDKPMRGKRTDHDELPEEAQAAYTQNASILQQMREAHLQLRNATLHCKTCKDSERFAFVTELIRLDKIYHKNWEIYDNAQPIQNK